MTTQIDSSKYILAALKEIPEVSNYMMILAQRCDGDSEALGGEIYKWLEKTWCHGYMIEDQSQTLLAREPKEPMTEAESERMSRYQFLSELLKHLLSDADSDVLGEYYSKKYFEFRSTCNHWLKDELGLDPFGVS